MNYEWDPKKARVNLRKHGIDFADAATVFSDELALTIVDEGAGESCLVTTGMDALGQLLVVVWVERDDVIRLISARRATKRERTQYEG